IVRDDVFTSIHIEEFEVMARDTKLGPEEITRDIPNVGDEALADLDESGIIRIGAEVKPGDILVGKITPKGETQLSPEEKLLRAIFGEKAGEVRDTSLRVPPGVEGTVINVRIFSRKGTGKDERSRVIEDEDISKLKKDQHEEIRILQDGALRRTAAQVRDDNRKVLVPKGKEIADEDLEEIPMTYWGEIRVDNESVEAELKRVVESTTEQVELLKVVFQDKINKLKSGDELPPGVIKMVKTRVSSRASCRKRTCRISKTAPRSMSC
ncbi:MAG: DNA-directed RNA polymerase, beta subunit, partial [Deltaproteobacteria bacterium]|nr:DNA-directed RNA polymerase, beta subunit [Deltaproteobacteria bacterium]